LLWELHVFIW